ncbi:hypothetical protein [Spirosoma fluminis]
MMQEQRIIGLAQAIAGDIKTLTTNQGNLASLNTAAKTSLVAALNELQAAVASATNISDGTTGTSTTWSSTKISTAIAAATAALVNGSAAALDTLKELADALGGDANFAATTATALGKRVRVDSSQTFTALEQAQACANIGIGNPDTDFVSIYNTAKA